MPDGFLAIAAICRPRGATCWVLQVGLSFKLICHSAVEPRVTGRTKLARRKRGSYSYHINQTTVTLTISNTTPLAPAPARNKLSVTLRRLPDSSTDQVRLARKASSITSGERPGSFDPMLGPWSRGAVCGDRCLPVDLAPTPGSEHPAGRAGNPQKNRRKMPPTVFRPAR